MNKQMNSISNDVDTLAEDARALMAATADIAGEKVVEARKRLTAALELDPRYNVPRIGRVKVAHGLDAVDGAFATIYGEARG